MKRNSSEPDKEPIYNLLPERAKNPLGCKISQTLFKKMIIIITIVHVKSGSDSSKHSVIGRIDEDKMGR